MSEDQNELLPLWRRTADTIADQIRAGLHPPGSRLPAERVLCETLGVSRVTLRKALQTLTDDGVLQASRGRGWFVSADDGEAARSTPWPNSLESFSETAARKGLPSRSEVLAAAMGEFSLDLADELGVAPGTPCFHLRRLRLMDTVAIGIDDSRIVASAAPGIELVDFGSASLFEELTERGASPVHAVSLIEAGAATEEEGGPLGLEPGQPVLRMRQILTDARRRPIMLTTISYRGDRYRLQTTFTRS
ncbi:MULTISPECIES: GntR family transcriptional regulator [unclassified Isoptericola]|uniref:GntR family transcriptional regulator n=1 Tax=unclassified Isoptericola TaxID=2623355 RepID=UPI00365DCDAB